MSNQVLRRSGCLLATIALIALIGMLVGALPFQRDIERRNQIDAEFVAFAKSSRTETDTTNDAAFRHAYWDYVEDVRDQHEIAFAVAYGLIASNLLLGLWLIRRSRTSVGVGAL